MRNLVRGALGIALLFVRLTQADPITIQITGEVTAFSYWRGPVINIPVGSVFTGTYTYDSSTPNSGTFSPQVGTYLHNSPCGFDISLGGYEFRTAPNGQLEMDIWHNFVGKYGPVADEYYIRSGLNFPLPNGASYEMIWDLKDNTHTALSSIALPVTAPVLNDWGVNSFSIDYPNCFSIGGTVTQAVLIPEPVTGVLMVTGLLLLRRRR
jgi:hypothetical protein